ncbi:HsdM family class I SAM-dependent methyltransferase [Caballeronia sordidicola]|uniref:Type I restriction-modification system, M subunit n=1 Tax=Caballeronia sordidicola TaxID=196367 RepID=A0A226WWY0_CABSO|nr:N-6 DNA methylase [Caballeronia sordidicola]OXC75684.1 Type I restriction-modification system, M subunit [Caballeronia sordidicola]
MVSHEYSSFADARADFDRAHEGKSQTPCIVPVDGKSAKPARIRNAAGEPIEEYFKWQFVNSMVFSGLYSKDYIGVEIRFPKGSAGSHPLKIDAAIFDSPEWVEHYSSFWKSRDARHIEWLSDHLLAIVEFKKNDKDVDKVFVGQIKPAMREKEPGESNVLGIYYDFSRLFIFQRRNGRYIRYDESKNQKGDASAIGDLSLHLPDPYVYLPSFDELKETVNRPAEYDRSARSLAQLSLVTSIASAQIQLAFSEVLRALDRGGLVNQRGYSILIQVFALKIFDEKRNAHFPQRNLDFYVSPDERSFAKLSEKPIQEFIKRIKALRDAAAVDYRKILKQEELNWKDANHVRAAVAICEAFQDYSFVKSAKSDLYQLVFYNFANSFKRDDAAQFLTPIPVIDFIVKLVNPRSADKVIDPCCGIGDFLSLAFVHSREKAPGWGLDDANIYGVDLDANMISLATLNMLLNGDGEAKLFERSDKGSILSKVALPAEGSGAAELVELDPGMHKGGKWDEWSDGTELVKFDVVLTNPPFGDDRAYRPKTEFDKRVIELYETWGMARERKAGPEDAEGQQKKTSAKPGDALDLGVVFLENAYRILKDDGRLGIVLSNSIASINKYAQIRHWLMSKMRIVALFDLPSNVFAETGVNTSIIIAYKPKKAALKKLNEAGYSVFVRDIKQVGYERRTSKRNVFFNPIYKIDEESFEIMVDRDGRPVLDEEFTQTVADFQGWALGQEEMVGKLFVSEGKKQGAAKGGK